MGNKIFDLPFSKDIEETGFEILTLKELYEANDGAFLSSMKRLDFYEILFIEEGNGYHNIDFDIYKLKKGSILFIGKKQVHSWQEQLTINGYVMLFTENFLYKNQIQFGDLAYNYPFNYIMYKPLMIVSDNKLYNTFLTLLQLIYQEYSLQRNKLRQELLQTLLRTFIVKVKSQLPREEMTIDNESKQKFIQLQRAVDEHIGYTRSAVDYANMLGLSYHQLNSIVKKLTKKSLKAFIDEMLMLNAKRLLCDKEHNINEIAYILGFDEPTNFTKFFKKHHHQTPKHFREIVLK